MATLLISPADIAIFTAAAGEIVVDTGRPVIMHRPEERSSSRAKPSRPCRPILGLSSIAIEMLLKKSRSTWQRGLPCAPREFGGTTGKTGERGEGRTLPCWGNEDVLEDVLEDILVPRGLAERGRFFKGIRV